MTMTISGAAGAVADSRVAVEQAAAALAEAEARRDLVKRRIAEKQAERAEIVGARKAGVETQKDGPRLMVIAADAENLEAMLAEAEADVARTTAAADKVKRALAQTEADLARRTDEELLARLVEHAAKVDAILLRTIQEINAACGRLGRLAGREPWVPTPTLVEELRRRDLTREFRK